MLMTAARRSDGLRPRPLRLLLGLFLYAVTWTLIPTVTEIAPDTYREGTFWTSLWMMEFLYFLPGLALALVFSGCLHLWHRFQKTQEGRSAWLRLACTVSLALSVLEIAFFLVLFSDGNILHGWTWDTPGFLVSTMSGLFVSGVLGACCWAEPSRRVSR